MNPNIVAYFDVTMEEYRSNKHTIPDNLAVCRRSPVDKADKTAVRRFCLQLSRAIQIVGYIICLFVADHSVYQRLCRLLLVHLVFTRRHHLTGRPAVVRLLTTKKAKWIKLKKECSRPTLPCEAKRQ